MHQKLSAAAPFNSVLVPTRKSRPPPFRPLCACRGIRRRRSAAGSSRTHPDREAARVKRCRRDVITFAGAQQQRRVLAAAAHKACRRLAASLPPPLLHHAASPCTPRWFDVYRAAASTSSFLVQAIHHDHVTSPCLCPRPATFAPPRVRCRSSF